MKTNAQKWTLVFVSSVLVFVMVLSAVVYIIDPFFQFRVRDNSYMLKSRYVGCGLIKNYDYDTLILGSSMTQNFNMDVFREQLGVNPLHVGVSGIRADEELDLLKLSYMTGKAKKYYICAEMYMFTNDYEENRIPQYLIKEDILSRCRYFFNYEAWFRYMPVDVGFAFANSLGINLPKKYQYKQSIDHLENWSLDYTFDEDVVIKNYLSGSYGVTQVDTNGLYDKMTAKIDDYFNNLQLDKGEHIFFFAPYSMLYWADTSDELFSVLLDGQEYFINKALEKGVTVYNFQAADFTSNLNLYKDTTHYAPEINDWMTQMFATREYVVTSENYASFESALIKMRSDFRASHADLFVGH